MPNESTIREFRKMGEPIKSIPKGNDTIITLVKSFSYAKNIFQMTISGQSHVFWAYFDKTINDFGVVGDSIYFCGDTNSPQSGYVASYHINDLFNGLSGNWLFPQVNTLTKMLVYYNNLGEKKFAMLTEDNKMLDYNSNTSSFNSYNIADYNLWDVIQTRKYVCVIGTSPNSLSANRLHLFFYDKNSLNPPINHYYHGLNGPVIAYAINTYLAEITALHPSTDFIMTGTHTAQNNHTYMEFNVINLDNTSHTTTHLIPLSLNGHPHIFDLEYSIKYNKVLCLAYTLDLNKDILFNIDPTQYQNYITQVLIPEIHPYMSNSINQYAKNYLKDITFYADHFYLVCGEDLHYKQYFFDKRYNEFKTNNCYKLMAFQVFMTERYIENLNPIHPDNIPTPSSATKFAIHGNSPFKVICK